METHRRSRCWQAPAPPAGSGRQTTTGLVLACGSSRAPSSRRQHHVARPPSSVGAKRASSVRQNDHGFFGVGVNMSGNARIRRNCHSPILRDWLPCAASTRSYTSSPGADPSRLVTSCLVMIDTSSSFHALPYVHGTHGSSWLLRSYTQESEPDSLPLVAVMAKTIPDADGRPFRYRSTDRGFLPNPPHAAHGMRGDMQKPPISMP